MTAAHAIAASQPTVDGSSQGDWGGGRAASRVTKQIPEVEARLFKDFAGLTVDGIVEHLQHDANNKNGVLALVPLHPVHLCRGNRVRVAGVLKSRARIVREVHASTVHVSYVVHAGVKSDLQHFASVGCISVTWWLVAAPCNR